MIILAIDPGPTQSAFVVWDADANDFFKKDKDGIEFPYLGIVENEMFFQHPPQEYMNRNYHDYNWQNCLIAIEMIQSYGMPLGRTSFETILFIGKLLRHIEMVYDGKYKYKLYGRPTIKGHFGISGKSTDAKIRACLRERHGEAKKGEKLEGVKKDIWSALAIAVALTENPKLKEW